jgi:phage FluMu gp28-like protein
VLYRRQHDELRALYPLPRKKKTVEDQSVFRLELAGGGWLEALPGKNPDKIRSEHPTIVMMDEAAFNENGAEAYANAISTRPKKLLAISSANPGWFFDLIEPAVACKL